MTIPPSGASIRLQRSILRLLTGSSSLSAGSHHAHFPDGYRVEIIELLAIARRRFLDGSVIEVDRQPATLGRLGSQTGPKPLSMCESGYVAPLDREFQAC